MSEDQVVQKSSVEITRNAKGDTQFTVKARHEDITVARIDAEREYNQLCADYQKPEGK